MAEYSMSYQEIKILLEQLISESEDSDFLNRYRPIILASLTSKDALENEKLSTKESSELWKNQIGTPSELLLGTRYFVMKDTIIEFVKALITSGMLKQFFISLSDPEQSFDVTSLESGCSLILRLSGLLQRTAKLEDQDFCIYLQAVTHYKTHTSFTLNDMQEWFPNSETPICNMHNSKWQCDYLTGDDSCQMLHNHNLSTALASLVDKNILSKNISDGQVSYRFKW